MTCCLLPHSVRRGNSYPFSTLNFGGWHHTNDHSWLFKRSPRFTDEIYWEAGLFLRAPFTRGATELIIKPCPLAARICCTFSPTSFSSVQLLYWVLSSFFDHYVICIVWRSYSLQAIPGNGACLHYPSCTFKVQLCSMFIYV